MKSSNCGDCPMRKKYDRAPKSFTGRLWRWHIAWCPGWKSYMASLPADARDSVKVQYGLK